MFVARVIDDLPDLPHSRQLTAGFRWLRFEPGLEDEFRRTNLDENLQHIRVNLSLAVVIILAFTAAETLFLGPERNRIPSMLHILVMVPILLLCLGSTFSPLRHRFHSLLAPLAGAALGLSMLAVELVAAGGVAGGPVEGAPTLFPCLLLTTMFIFFMGGLLFYESLAANLLVTLAFVGAGTLLQPGGRDFLYHAMCLMAADLFGASVMYMHERTSRLRFLEAELLRELVARDGLTGIQNRRMFDQHIRRVWQQAVRGTQQIAVLLIDVDCFKAFNDRYGHQAGDECLRAVAVSLSQCARRPLDFVARYGGEEFAMVLYDAGRDYLTEVLTRIQRSIAELNIAHDASAVACRVTVSIGAAVVLPLEGRTCEGLIQLADEALYCAKEQGRNRVVVMESEYETLRTGRFEKRPGQRKAG